MLADNLITNVTEYIVCQFGLADLACIAKKQTNKNDFLIFISRFKYYSHHIPGSQWSVEESIFTNKCN